MGALHDDQPGPNAYLERQPSDDAPGEATARVVREVLEDQAEREARRKTATEKRKRKRLLPLPLVALLWAVLSAGTGTMGPVIATPLEEWERVLSTNLTGAFLALKHAGAAMRTDFWARPGHEFPYSMSFARSLIFSGMTTMGLS